MHKPMLIAQIKMVALFAIVVAVGGASAQVLSQVVTPGLLENNRDVRAPVSELTLPSLDPEATIHLASYYTTDAAMRGWDLLSSEYAKVLSPYDPILRDIDLGREGHFVRLLAGPIETYTEAYRLCAALEQAGAYCATADLTGEFLNPSEERDR